MGGVRVGVVGTAGRRSNGEVDRLTLKLYNGMVTRAKEIIQNTFGLELSRVHLFSGGAAWAGE